MITLNLFESNWWDNKCFNKCKQTFFGHNNKKVGKFCLFCLLFKYFNMLQNPGKC